MATDVTKRLTDTIGIPPPAVGVCVAIPNVAPISLASRAHHVLGELIILVNYS